MARVLCALADLAATGAKEIVLTKDGGRYPVFVIRHGDGVRAYENSCPHARLPLNMAEDVFFDVRRTVLVCVNHGAHFDPATGICLRGPCKGQRLREFRVTTDGTAVLIP